MTVPLPEPWLRGLIPGVAAELQPVAHAFAQSLEDIERVTAQLTIEQLWMQPGGAPSIGFHLLHLAGSTDRLQTYARGEMLTETQRAALRYEADLSEPRPTLDGLRAGWRAAVERATAQVVTTPVDSLDQPRAVGRLAMGSNVRGLLFHSAEHAQRHTGSVIATERFVRERPE